MSLNKGKAKAKPTAKSAGKNKAAVMNSRSPKKPMAISGDTMSNYAMYKKGGLVKAQAGIWKKEKSINEDGSSMTRRTSNNPITGNRRVVTKIKSADGDKSRSVKISSRQKGGKVRKYQDGGRWVQGSYIPDNKPKYIAKDAASKTASSVRRAINPKANPKSKKYQDGGPKDGGPAISDPKLKQRSREFIGRPEKLDPRMDPMMKPYKSIQSRPLPPQIKEGITPESSRTSKYRVPATEYRKQKGGKTSPPPIGTGSKVDMIKNLYKKYIKK